MQGKLLVDVSVFLLPKEESKFREMLESHARGFTFSPQEIGCVNSTNVEPIVLFIVPHVSWNLKLNLVPRARLPNLIKLLKEKINIGIREPLNTLFFNRLLIFPENNGSLCFIQDRQPLNHAIIRNTKVGLSIDEFVEAFMGRSVYSIGDLYLGSILSSHG